MNFQKLKTAQAKGIILGIIVAVMLAGFDVPPGFAVVVGILFGSMVYVVLNDHNKGR